MEIKNLEVPIRDFDTSSYDDVEFIPKEPVVVEIVEESVDLCLATERELLDYFRRKFKESHGYEYKIDWLKDTAIFRSFISRYGPDAGPMVRILFENHNGKLNAVDGVITVTAFSKAAKWIQDMLYCDLQEEKKKKVLDNSAEGLITSNDFRKAFNVAK